MRTGEDKYIANKVNSLDTLPEGYHPNMTSKWEMIEMAQEKKKRLPVYFRLAIAACFMLIVGIAYFVMNRKNDQGLVVEKQNKQEKITTNPSPSHPSKKEAPTKFEVVRAEQKSLTSSKQTLEIIVPANSVDTIQTVAIGQNIAEEKKVDPSPSAHSVSTASPITAKKPGQRYFQMDFGTGTTNDPRQKVASGKAFHFKLSSKETTDGNGSSPTKMNMPQITQPL